MMVWVIDNYDSFTYNLVQYVGELGYPVHVVRNDGLTPEDLPNLAPEALILSPGPGRPEDAGITPAAIAYFKDKCPILGVCLGHQAIGCVFGARVVAAPEPVHGKDTLVYHDGRTLYREVPNPFRAGRYHSLIVAREGLPDCLTISAETADGLIMGLRHKDYPIEGVQFHPESVLTEQGKRLIENFLRRTI
ncbi:MAG: aminodeoxychorismate/anthranilate synthase component II [candidate division KSB1 bacterium]|nr:aminodeoxychorismate/anthranilate synthase component II [candidate division KSB1 bacterium]